MLNPRDDLYSNIQRGNMHAAMYTMWSATRQKQGVDKNSVVSRVQKKHNLGKLSRTQCGQPRVQKYSMGKLSRTQCGQPRVQKHNVDKLSRICCGHPRAKISQGGQNVKDTCGVVWSHL